MHRRLGFILSGCGMLFVALPMARILPQQDFVVFVVGLAFTLLGIYFSIESVSKK